MCIVNCLCRASGELKTTNSDLYHMSSYSWAWNTSTTYHNLSYMNRFSLWSLISNHTGVPVKLLISKICNRGMGLVAHVWKMIYPQAMEFWASYMVMAIHSLIWRDAFTLPTTSQSLPRSLYLLPGTVTAACNLVVGRHIHSPCNYLLGACISHCRTFTSYKLLNRTMSF